MVSNLLVVLCGERGTQPVVNTGTLHHEAESLQALGRGDGTVDLGGRPRVVVVAERKAFLLRIDPAVLDALQRVGRR